MVRSVVGHARDPLYLNAYALMASNVVTSGLGFVYWAIAARLYSVETVGLSSALISLVTFLTAVSQLNLRAVLLRLVPEAGAGTARLVIVAYLASVLASALVAATAFAVLGALGIEPVASLQGGRGVSIVAIVLLTIGTLAWSIYNIQDGVLAGLRRTVWVPVENAIYSVAKIVLLVVLAVSLPALGIVVSWFVPFLFVVAGVTAVLFWRWIPQHAQRAGGAGGASMSGEGWPPGGPIPETSTGGSTTIALASPVSPPGGSPPVALLAERGRLVRYIASDYAASLFALAVSSLIPVLIAASLGPAEGAYFYLAWIVSVSLDLVPINMAASLTVETASGHADLPRTLRRTLVHMARLLVPAALLVALFAPLLLSVFGSAYASRSTDLLRVLALGVIPYAVIAVSLAVARVRGRSRELVAIQAALAVLTLGGSVLLIGPLGIVGVGVAVLAARLIVAAVLVVVRIRPTLSGSPARS